MLISTSRSNKTQEKVLKSRVLVFTTGKEVDMRKNWYIYYTTNFVEEMKIWLH